MTIKTHHLVLEMSVRELEVWMSALRMAAKQRAGQVTPWDSCGFFIQHGELVRLTGYSAGDHEDLKELLRNRGKEMTGA